MGSIRRRQLRQKQKAAAKAQPKGYPKGPVGYTPPPVTKEQMARMLSMAKQAKTILVLDCPCIICGAIVYVHATEDIKDKIIVTCKRECADEFYKLTGIPGTRTAVADTSAGLSANGSKSVSQAVSNRGDN